MSTRAKLGRAASTQYVFWYLYLQILIIDYYSTYVFIILKCSLRMIKEFSKSI